MEPMTAETTERTLRAADSADQFNRNVDSMVFPAPKADDPATLVLDLPGGFISPDGRLHRTVELRELTGADEEALAKFDPATHMAQFLRVLLERGVGAIGDMVPPSPELFGGLLMGDREMIALGIRRATYGDELELSITCTNCGERGEVGVDLIEDIKVHRLEDGEERTFDVKLKGGETALVRIPLASDQDEVTSSKRETVPELNSIMLNQIVLNVDGQKVSAQKLRAADRKTILAELEQHLVGPDFNDIPVPCGRCGKEDILISLNLLLLFR